MSSSERFETLGLVGRGGMGEVFKVKDRTTGRVCALKVPRVRNENEQHSQFIKECSVWFEFRQIGYVVQVYEIIQQEDGRPAILMEYIEPGSLRPFVGDNSFSLQDRLMALSDLENALRACSAVVAGFAHLDIKPENCLRTEHGLTKLSDFGIAHVSTGDLRNILTDCSTADPAVSLLIKTHSGSLCLGTPLYMAPEQVRGMCSDGPKADVYSFGLTAHELLAGEHPLLRQGLQGVIRSSIHGIASEYRRWPSTLPRSTRRVLDSCLEVKPKNRPSLLDLGKVLFEALDNRHQSIAIGQLTRLPDLQHDAIRKARSLWALAQTDAAVNLMKKTLEIDPFLPECWIQLARWHYETIKPSARDSDELASWVARGKILSHKFTADDLHICTMILHDASLKALVPTHGVKDSADKIPAWIEERMRSESVWLSGQARKTQEAGGNNRCLCVRCGEVKMHITQRCPRCGFYVESIGDIYHTCLLMVSRLRLEPDTPYWERMRVLRNLGTNIDQTIRDIETMPDYRAALRHFEQNDGQIYLDLVRDNFKGAARKFEKSTGRKVDLDAFFKHIKQKLSRLRMEEEPRGHERDVE